MSDVKRNEHMLPIANWLREQINETLARYDIPSDIYDTDILIDALCVCAVDKAQAALRARLTAEREFWINIYDDEGIQYVTTVAYCSENAARAAADLGATYITTIRVVEVPE